MTSECGQLQLNLMKGKIESLRQKYSKKVNLSFDLIPLDPEQYARNVFQVSQSMKLIDPTQKDLSLYDELILGKIEGQSAYSDFKPMVQAIVGEVPDKKLKEYLKQKTQQRNFGLTNKDKNCSLKQVKKIQTLKKYFNIIQIQKKRKYNTHYRTSLKNLQKFIELFQKLTQQSSQNIGKAYDQYLVYMKQEKKFQAFIAKQFADPTTIVQKQLIIEVKPEIIEAEEKVVSEDPQANVQKVQKIQNSKKQQQNNQNVITPKKNSKGFKKPKKQATQEENNEALEARARQAQEIQRQNTIKKQLSKKNSLFAYSFVKKTQNPQTVKKSVDAEVNELKSLQQKKQCDIKEQVKEQKAPSIWDNLFDQNRQRASIESLRSQLRGFKMQNECYPNQSYIINMAITLSTIQYQNHLMIPQIQISFTTPFTRIRQVIYFQDESQQYDGENASLSQEQEEDSQLSKNNTILNSDHLSAEEISSCQSGQMEIKVQYGKGIRWIFNTRNLRNTQDTQLVQQYQMISLQSESLPLKLDEQQQTNQLVITPQIWRDIYRTTHASYGIKDIIIKQISLILPNVSKTWIDSMLKQRSQKSGNQRFIKKDFIQDLKQKFIDIEQNLQLIKLQRNAVLKRIKDQKNQQKDKKLQKDILQCTGSRYIVNLFKQLKQKGYKQIRKNQLLQFINQRNGQEWDKIKKEINTMSRPIQQMIMNMPAPVHNGQICDEEVVVEDDQFNKIDQKQQKVPNNHQKEQSKIQNAQKDLKKEKRKQLKKVKQGAQFIPAKKGRKSQTVKKQILPLMIKKKQPRRQPVRNRLLVLQSTTQNILATTQTPLEMQEQYNNQQLCLQDEIIAGNQNANIIVQENQQIQDHKQNNEFQIIDQHDNKKNQIHSTSSQQKDHSSSFNEENQQRNHLQQMQ